MYIANTNALYISNANKVTELTETEVGETNFILPEVYALLENYYVGIGNKLYISKSVTDNGKFKWYFPEISVQPFDNSITNLQPISNSEVAIFLKTKFGTLHLMLKLSLMVNKVYTGITNQNCKQVVRKVPMY